MAISLIPEIEEKQIVVFPSSSSSSAPSSSSTSTTSSTLPNAAERNYADIDFKTYLFSTFALCTVRSIILHPLFIIVTRKQVCSDTVSKSFFQMGKSLVRDEGGIVKGLTQGMLAMVAGSAISETVQNAVFEYGRYSLGQTEHVSSTATAAAGAGWVADWSSRIVFSPFNVIAVRQMTFNCHERTPPPTAEELTANRKKLYFQNNKTGHMIRESYRSNGVKSFFGGIGFNLFVGSFTSSIFFAVYLKSKEVAYSRFGDVFREIEEERRLILLEQQQYQNHHVTGSNHNEINNINTNDTEQRTVRRRWYHRLPKSFTCSTDNFVLNSSASIFASLASSFLANPYFVLLGKVQIGKADNIRHAFKLVMMERGVKGFFRGAMAGTFATIFENFLASTTYELAMKFGVTKE